LTNFEANAKQNEVKINNRFSEELPADADETNVKTRVFLCYASNSIKSQSSTFFGGCSTPWYFHRRHKINEFKHIFRKELLPHSRPYSMSYAGHQVWAGQLETGEIILQK
jgi:hypothetical protein